MFPGPLSHREAVVDLVAERLESGYPAVLQVGTGSMAPSIRAGDTIALVPFSIRRPRRGDVVAWRAPGGRVVVHRVVARLRRHSRRWIITKGDSSAVEDPPVDPRHVIGRVVEVRRGGLRVDSILAGPRALRRAAFSGLEALLARLPVVRILPAAARSTGRFVFRQLLFAA